MTIYRLLGELEISHEGPLVELPGGPTLIVLAALLVNANRRMSKTELIRAAWGNDEISEAQLYKRVMAVRDLLTKIGRRDDLKTHARSDTRYAYRRNSPTPCSSSSWYGRPPKRGPASGPRMRSASCARRWSYGGARIHCRTCPARRSTRRNGTTSAPPSSIARRSASPRRAGTWRCRRTSSTGSAAITTTGTPVRRHSSRPPRWHTTASPASSTPAHQAPIGTAGRATRPVEIR